MKPHPPPSFAITFHILVFNFFMDAVVLIKFSFPVKVHNWRLIKTSEVLFDPVEGVFMMNQILLIYKTLWQGENRDWSVTKINDSPSSPHSSS